MKNSLLDYYTICPTLDTTSVLFEIGDSVRTTRFQSAVKQLPAIGIVRYIVHNIPDNTPDNTPDVGGGVYSRMGYRERTNNNRDHRNKSNHI